MYNAGRYVTCGVGGIQLISKILYYTGTRLSFLHSILRFQESLPEPFLWRQIVPLILFLFVHLVFSNTSYCAYPHPLALLVSIECLLTLAPVVIVSI
jgi:hypothetical protein